MYQIKMSHALRLLYQVLSTFRVAEMTVIICIYRSVLHQDVKQAERLCAVMQTVLYNVICIIFQSDSKMTLLERTVKLKLVAPKPSAQNVRRSTHDFSHNNSITWHQLATRSYKMQLLEEAMTMSCICKKQNCLIRVKKSKHLHSLKNLCTVCIHQFPSFQVVDYF